MKKCILLAALLLIPVAARAANDNGAGKISAVVIEGCRNVKEKSVRSQIKSRAKKLYSDDQVKTDIQNILSMGSFDDVEVNLDTATMRLTFTVKEKAYVKKISIKGNKKISKGRIEDELTLKEKEYFDASKLDESKTKVLALYHDKGYADAKIEIYPTVDELQNLMTVSILVTEGNRILIGAVEVEGVKAYKPKKILGLMDTKKKKVYKEETLRKDIDEIKKFYKNNGYLKIDVGEPVITFNSERTQMFIKLPVSEGEKYRIGTITFSGNTVFTEAELRKELTVKAKEVYNDEKFQDTRASILDLYYNKGYLNARVEPEMDFQKEKGILNINLAIHENEIIYVGNIYIEGLQSTKEYVIRRELNLQPGDVLAKSKLQRSMEKINNLGFIDAIEPEFQPTEKPDVMDLVMNITEGKPGMLSAGAGYSSIDQFVWSIQVSHINLLGRAQRLNLTWEYGARRQNYQVGWTEPWFLNKPMSLGFDVFDTKRKIDYGTTPAAYYSQITRGGDIKLGPRLSDYLNLLFTYSYEEIEILEIDNALLYPTDSNGNVTASLVSPSKALTSSLSSQITYDTRDNIFDASRGQKQSFSVQVAGGPFGGDVNFVKPIAKSSWFFPTWWKFVLSLNSTFGMVENFAPSTDVPIYEKFYVGGADTVRGYQYRSEIGPSDGGKVMFVTNVEYKFPIVQEKKHTILQGALFYDVGGAWKSMNDFSLSIGQDTNYMKSGFGFGIRFTTPVFPLRLDWGYGLNHKTGEDLSQFYFTIGNIF